MVWLKILILVAMMKDGLQLQIASIGHHSSTDIFSFIMSLLSVAAALPVGTLAVLFCTLHAPK